MSSDIRAVIFDSDGTLVDSEVPAMDRLHEMASAVGVQQTREEAHRRFRGVRMSDVTAWIGTHLHDKPADFEAEFTKRYRAAMAAQFKEELHPMPGARELLARLKIPFAVATNGPREKVELTLALTGLLPFFGERVFSAYEMGYFKPDPRLFLEAARVLGAEPRHCAVVEDSVPGLEAGLAAGMRVFSLHEPVGIPADIAERVTFVSGLPELSAYF